MGRSLTIYSSPFLGKLLFLFVLFGQFVLRVQASPVAPARGVSSGYSSGNGDGSSDQITLDNILGPDIEDESKPKTEYIPIIDGSLGSEETTTGLPSWLTSTLLARRLLALSTTGVVSTTFPDPLPSTRPYSRTPPEVAGHSFNQKEYFADCDEYLFPNGSDADYADRGNPIFLSLYIATTFRNIAAGSKNVSLSIDWWDHLEDTEPLYPGFPLSPAGLPRVTLLGYVEPLERAEEHGLSEETERALERCYIERHPDAAVWLPGREGSPHASFWAKLIVKEAYWIGGFGDIARIGWLDISEWKKLTRKTGGEDGRGWGDVRLPGEK
ncbi:hypothetical protein MPDQ_004579 [Monascus purpureus]|uniref:CREG-like beta-barrel domain-containing protein n=1 Tax=Monascus purpureus TaxID=5098 RepID=A0A507R6F7_MONPU|nr:hypothetical protein MPDQ_004579 [Monascus purpureus]BDD61600.1 hypothetical protein MAP00_006640 [Monascus purpureus]